MRLELLAVSLLFLPACDGMNPAAPTETATPALAPAAFTLSASPSPVVASACTSQTCGYGPDWIAVTSAVVRETGGGGATVDGINVTLREATVDFSGPAVALRAGTNHVSPNGTLSIPVGIIWGGDRAAAMTITVRFTDERGVKSEKVVTVPVI